MDSFLTTNMYNTDSNIQKLLDNKRFYPDENATDKFSVTELMTLIDSIKEDLQDEKKLKQQVKLTKENVDMISKTVDDLLKQLKDCNAKVKSCPKYAEIARKGINQPKSKTKINPEPKIKPRENKASKIRKGKFVNPKPWKY